MSTRVRLCCFSISYVLLSVAKQFVSVVLAVRQTQNTHRQLNQAQPISASMRHAIVEAAASHRMGAQRLVVAIKLYWLSYRYGGFYFL